MVRVRVPTRDGNTQEGFGFIVSGRSGSLYIVTPDHLVSGTPDTPSPSVSVIFFTDQGNGYKGELLKHQRAHDLALLRVVPPLGFKWEKQCLAPLREAKRGTSVSFVGRQGQWYVPVVGGAISSESPTADSWLEVDMPRLRAGSTGGPLVTTTGIIGMISTDTPDGTQVLIIEYMRAVVQEWGYPWDLTIGTVSK